MANTNRFSAYTSVSAGSEGKDGEKKKDLWISMLESVASGKRLPEKNLLVLGGTADSQRDFLEDLSHNEARRGLDRHGVKVAPVANSFALGYTYYDVLDADQEDNLARISLYLLANPSPAFSSLLRPLLTPQSIPNTLIVILVDWSQPWRWMRQLREWILLLRTVLVSLSDECKVTMEEVMLSWRDRGRGGGTNLDGSGTAVATGQGDVALPLGPGEWEDGLGLPLCVVCQNAEKMEVLEKIQGWKEEEFDVVLQYLRTALLRHGASLIYTTPNIPSQLPTLVHSTLGITSLLRRQPLKANTIDRDKIVVPPNWDSWSKIRVLRDGFDVEAVSVAWSADLERPFPARAGGGGENGASIGAADAEPGQGQPSTVDLYETSIRDPSQDALALAGRSSYSTKLEVTTDDTQEFLTRQLKLLETYRHKTEEAQEKESRERAIRRPGELDSHLAGDARVNEHIGPVQFNMGGIQVDADDMVERMKNRQMYGSSPEPTSPEQPEPTEETTQPIDTENLQAFFSGLMNRKPAKAG